MVIQQPPPEGAVIALEISPSILAWLVAALAVGLSLAFLWNSLSLFKTEERSWTTTGGVSNRRVITFSSFMAVHIVVSIGYISSFVFVVFLKSGTSINLPQFSTLVTEHAFAVLSVFAVLIQVSCWATLKWLTENPSKKTPDRGLLKYTVESIARPVSIIVDFIGV